MVDKSRINNTLGKMEYYLSTHNSICVGVSGGSDSDIIVHLVATHYRNFLDKVHFVFSNTGVEYKATLNHLDDLEKKYSISIKRLGVKDGVMPIPLAVKKYGVPFISKQVSEYGGRLQKHGFDFSFGELEELCDKFPHTRAALRWWCNDWGDISRFNINWNKWLKEFMIESKPDFQMSAMCCQKSKKEPLISFQRSIGADLLITGERKSEGGQRASKKSCFENSHGIDHFMPLFFWNDETKKFYKEFAGIRYSDCYEVYGLKRTGCVGCPFARDIKNELEILKKYEPNLYNACVNIFGQSYRFTNDFEKYKKQRKGE